MTRRLKVVAAAVGPVLEPLLTGRARVLAAASSPGNCRTSRREIRIAVKACGKSALPCEHTGNPHCRPIRRKSVLRAKHVSNRYCRASRRENCTSKQAGHQHCRAEFWTGADSRRIITLFFRATLAVTQETRRRGQRGGRLPRVGSDVGQCRAFCFVSRVEVKASLPYSVRRPDINSSLPGQCKAGNDSAVHSRDHSDSGRPADAFQQDG